MSGRTSGAGVVIDIGARMGVVVGVGGELVVFGGRDGYSVRLDRFLWCGGGVWGGVGFGRCDGELVGFDRWRSCGGVMWHNGLRA